MDRLPRVIGGEFEIEPSMFDPTGVPTTGTTMFASGRGALFAIVRESMRRHGVRRLLLPDYVCRSVTDAAAATGLPLGFYGVAENLSVDLPGILGALEESSAPTAVLLVDYFGLSDLDGALEALDSLPARPVIIIDSVQAPFHPDPLRGRADYAFTSLRKALPTPDGAAVLTRHAPVGPGGAGEAGFVAGKLVANILKGHPGLGDLPDSVYLQFSEAAECSLDESGFLDAPASAASRTILSHLDLGQAARRRQENFAYLAARLESAGIAPIRELCPGAVPLFLPVLMAGRDDVRAALAKNRIFCPVHWPSDDTRRRRPLTPRLYSHELSLVIDQRYGPAEMDRIADVVLSYRGTAAR